MSKNNLKFAFFGTPEISAATLEILKQNGYLPALIVTAPDRPKGRKMVVTPPPVKIWALQNQIPIRQPEKIQELENLKDSQFDLFVVVAYGKIFPKWLISLPKNSTINIHYSLLPKLRGASPVQSAILNGEKETGVSIQKMVKELDAGPIIAQANVAIKDTETTPELLNRLVEIGGKLLVKILPDYTSGKITSKEQDSSQATFCGKINKADGLIELDGNATNNYNKFRAFFVWPRTYFMKDGKRNIITEAKLKDSKFAVLKIIPEGGKEINFRN